MTASVSRRGWHPGRLWPGCRARESEPTRPVTTLDFAPGTARRERLHGPDVAAAIALLTRARARPDVTRSAVLDGHDPAAVLLAMETIAEALIDSALPAGRGTVLLHRVGLFAAGLAEDSRS
ncbi:MAG: hypothetical protein ACRDNZ_24055 [Streptosporangiaceae bacterium]